MPRGVQFITTPTDMTGAFDGSALVIRRDAHAHMRGGIRRCGAPKMKSLPMLYIRAPGGAQSLRSRMAGFHQMCREKERERGGRVREREWDKGSVARNRVKHCRGGSSIKASTLRCARAAYTYITAAHRLFSADAPPSHPQIYLLATALPM